MHHSMEGQVALSRMSLRHLRALIAKLLREGDQTVLLNYIPMEQHHAILVGDRGPVDLVPIGLATHTEIAYRHYLAGSRQAYGMAAELERETFNGI